MDPFAMRLKPLLCICAVALALAAPAEAAAPVGTPFAARAELVAYLAGFSLQGTNGYGIDIFGLSERLDGKGELYVGVEHKGERRNGALYEAPAIVSEDFIKAALGPFGKVNLAVHPSGRMRKINVKCSKHTYLFETGFYEGVVEFKGERNYTRASAARIPFQPPITSVCGRQGGGKGEGRGPEEKGARLRGVSFANGRRLSFQVNKNHPQKGRVPFSATLEERRAGIQIHRSVEGFAPANSFHFDPGLHSAELSLPSPFSGSATLRRRPNSVSPSWTGDLTVDFVGHPDARLAGPGVYVSLVHACFIYSGDHSTAFSC
jgi:hypothetical protein